ncbi:Acyltransferase 3 domain-containing protein [Tumidithrix helvetica PCC 7403]|uniref:acyltransferase family protein n=1 Tax=Tumidithrix helvetica TaxID=3457545 RepID=UPI003C7F53DF
MNKNKLLGIEFCRGLSTYAVIIVHSGDETWGLPIDPSAIAFRLNFYFAVPFFLAVAFYFMTAKPEIAYSWKFWRSRVERILIPYAIWSIIFFVLRVIIFTLTNKTDRLQQFLQDPLSIVFLGGASYHLYFLALLFAGTSLVLLMPFMERLKIGKRVLLFLSVVSIALYHLLEISGNSFQLGTNVAFQNFLSYWQINAEQHPLLRLMFVEIAWTIRCLPYFFVALTLNRLLQKTIFLHTRFVTVALAILFLCTDILGSSFLPRALQEIILADTLLLFSISLSSYLSDNSVGSFSANVGACSFGIYLIHPYTMNIVKSLVGKVIPELTASISISSMLALSIPCFLLSWVVVFYLTKNKLTAKYLFGI